MRTGVKVGMSQKNLVLILARDLADKLASAVFVVDRDGKLAYFNERAGEILGMSFAEAGHMPMQEWGTRFKPTDGDGRELAPDDLPLAVALRERHPDHSSFSILDHEGRQRDIKVTAMPLFATWSEFVGAIAMFWEDRPPDMPPSTPETP